MMNRLRASKNSNSESKAATLTVTVEGGLPSPVSTMTDESAVVRTMTKLETLTHRNNHGPHWSALEERPTPSSPASRASAPRLASDGDASAAARHVCRLLGWRIFGRVELAAKHIGLIRQAAHGVSQR